MGEAANLSDNEQRWFAGGVACRFKLGFPRRVILQPAPSQCEPTR